MKRYLLVFIFSSLWFLNHAAVERFTERISPSSLTIGSITNLYDQRFVEMNNPLWVNDFYNKRVSNKVKIGYEPDHFPLSDVDNSVSLQIDYWHLVSNVFVHTTVNKTLNIKFRADGQALMDDISTFSFEGAHRVKVTVTGITGSNAGNIYVESEIEVERYYNMPATMPENSGHRLAGSDNDYIEFFWDPVAGAESYELEWTFLSERDYNTFTNTFTYTDPQELDFDFYKNSTRVDILASYYQIPAIFNRGYIIYRVRAVGRQGNTYQYRKEGAWTMQRSGNVNSLTEGKIHITEDYEAGKNWQHQVSYTENGKRFEGVSFADGLGRGRQSVSHNTQTEQAVVSNVYYDRIGRPVVSDLPTPVDGEALKHYPNFNDGVAGGVETPYGYVHFDYDAAGICHPSTNPFATSKGAGLYYSSLNPNQEGANAFIPDAGGYPFAQVEYMNDQTGRIRRTGAYGAEHQLNAHSTQFFYDIPLQPELDKLFGTEVGNYKHYQRQVTVDANGQGYASYYDLAGRVIASCLTGDAPAALEALDNNTGGAIEENIIFEGLGGQITDPANGIAVYSFFKTVLKEEEYTLSHTFTPEEFTDACLPAGFCYDCFYDLTLKVTNTTCPGEGDYSHTETINGWTVNAMCDGTGYDGTTALLQLMPGQYNISKVLRVSEGAAEAYWCDFVSSSTCTPDYASLYNTAYADTDFGCTLPVDDGSEMNTCDKYRYLLAADMSPGGQYGNGELDALSIYNMDNTLPNDGDWRSPDGPYLDEDGNAARIYLAGTPGNYTPAVLIGGTIMTDVNGDSYIYPEDLANFADYESRWRFSWSFALVKYHPEYCYLKFCDENTDFHLYGQSLNATNTYDEACIEGFFNPLQLGVFPNPNPMNYFQGCPNTANPDGFFTSTAWLNLQAAISTSSSYGIKPLESKLEFFFKYENRNNQNLSLWEYAVWQVHCMDFTYSYTQVKDCIKDAVLTECEKDEVWRRFRNEYVRLRNEYYLIAQTMYVSYQNTLTGGGCGPAFNGCIGTSGYTFASIEMKYGFKPSEHLSSSGFSTAIVNTSGPCSTTNAASYAAKIRRFNNLPMAGEPPVPGYTLDPAGIEAYTANLVTDHCQTQCESYADEWMEKLAGCDLNTTEYDDIREALIEVCKGGCSAQNPGGATTDDLSTGLALPYTSFADVLDALAPAYKSAICSEYLISTPRPFGQNDTEKAGKTKLESCGCDKLLQAEWDLANTTPIPAGVLTVEDMLRWKTGIALADAGAMICACKKAYRDPWIPGATWNSASLASLAAAKVPGIESLTCKSCATCDDIQHHYENFLEEFEEEENFVSHENYEELFTNYMNNHLGYHLTLDEYETFMEGCHATSGEPLCTTTSLARVFKDLLDVIARQGKLTVGSGTPYDMADENVVYQYSNIASILNGSSYWTCGTGCSPGTMTMHFGDPGDKTIVFNLPEGADFDFSDILGVTDISAINSCGEDNIELAVRIVVCGEIVTRYITGASEDLELVKCYCESGKGSLCDALPYAPANPCYANELIVLSSVTEHQFNEQIASQHAEFVKNYIKQCYSAFETEKLAITGPESFYQFTLFYYDQAGNLVKTVAPNGSINNAFIASELANVHNDREAGNPNVPAQTYETKYKYNSYNQVISTTNPDQDGETVFYYDRYGRIVASQNPVQSNNGTYSYTLYDTQGRPVESGQISPVFPLSSTILSADDLGSSFQGWTSSGVKTEVTITRYDEPLSSPVNALFSNGQQNLRLRVASVLYFSTVTVFTDLTTAYLSAIHYSYDQHGNVVEQLQDVPLMAVADQAVKSTQYEFELISGNVKNVKYQPGKRDQMTHRYKYDQLNRLTEVFTSTDGNIHESREAHYRYYDYGPLARTETGQHKVQGMDYAYTINGWIKGMNSNTLKADRDMGLDGALGYLPGNGTVHENVARDVAGYTIGYFENDYKPIGLRTFEASVYGASNDFKTVQKQLYNGNISHLVTAIQAFEIQGTAYQYDQLQRLKGMRVFRPAGLAASNSWAGSAETSEYKNSYSYDENGNILSLVRNGTASGLLMDNFAYKYIGLDNLPVASSDRKSNRLDFVNDTGADDAANDGDIKAGMLTGNYTYDKIGQLTADATEGISEIKWYAGSKKVFKIVRSDANSPLVEFVYDPFGIRILKIEKPRIAGVVSASDAWKYTYYTHDANGQTMAVYETMLNTIGKDVHLEEQHIYGVGRIGMTVPHKLIYSGETTITDPAETWTHTLGLKNYEVTNYLGNVNAVVTDRKTLVARQAATITDLVGISVAGGVITKTGSGSWDAGGASAEAVNAGGYVEWTIGGSVLSANQDVMAGLSYTNAGANPNTIGYAWYTNPNGFAYIYESGTIVPGGSLGACTLGTVLGIRRESGMINYYLNGVLKRSVADPQPQTAMLADFSIRNTGAKIYDLKVSSHPAYDAVVVMKGDYYPFGMQMPAKIDPASGNTIGGNWNSTAYRYGYNGMEKDDEVKGGGNSYTTEFRQYDPRTGRWMSLDPMMAGYPEMSPFCAFNNNPIYYTDPFGLEGDPPAPGEPKKAPNSSADNSVRRERYLKEQENVPDGQEVEFVKSSDRYVNTYIYTYHKESNVWTQKYQVISQAEDREPDEHPFTKGTDVNGSITNRGPEDPQIRLPFKPVGLLSIPSSSISKARPEPKKINKAPMGIPKKALVPNIPTAPLPPRLDKSVTDFVNSSTTFDKSSRNKAYQELNKISNFMAANPTQKYLVIISSTSSRTQVVKAGNIERTVKALNYDRFEKVREIILNANPNIDPNNIDFLPLYEQSSFSFEVVPQ